MRNYRNAFAFALVGNLVLVGVLGGLWWRSQQHKKMQAMPQVSSGETAQNSPNGGRALQWRRRKRHSFPFSFRRNGCKALASRPAGWKARCRRRDPRHWKCRDR